MADYFVVKAKKLQMLKHKARQQPKYWIGLFAAFISAACALALLLLIWIALEMPMAYVLMLSCFVLATAIVIIEFIIMWSHSRENDSFAFRDRERISLSETTIQYTYFPTRSCTTTLAVKGEGGEYVVTEQLFDRVDIVIDLGTITRAEYNKALSRFEIDADYTIYNSRIDTGKLVTSKRVTGCVELYDYFEDMDEFCEIVQTHVPAAK